MAEAATVDTNCWQCEGGGYVVPANRAGVRGRSQSIKKCRSCDGTGRKHSPSANRTTADGVMGLASAWVARHDRNSWDVTMGGAGKEDDARAALESAVRAVFARLAEAERESARLRDLLAGVPTPAYWQARDPEALLYIRATTCAEIHAALAAQPPPAGEQEDA